MFQKQSTVTRLQEQSYKSVTTGKLAQWDKWSVSLYGLMMIKNQEVVSGAKVSIRNKWVLWRSEDQTFTDTATHLQCIQEIRVCTISVLLPFIPWNSLRSAGRLPLVIPKTLKHTISYQHTSAMQTIPVCSLSGENNSLLFIGGTKNPEALSVTCYHNIIINSSL